MAYRNVRTPLVTKNGIPYNLQYNLNTGDVQIIQQNAPAGTRPIYQDGKWNSSATALGFTDTEKNELHIQTIISIQAAYRSAGGVNSRSVLSQWASENFTTGIPNQSSVQPQSAVSGRIGGIGGIGVGTLRAPGGGGAAGGTTGGTPTRPGTGGGTTGTSSATTTTGAAGGGGIGALFGFLEDPEAAYKNFAVNGARFGVQNEKALFSGEMKYPGDLMTSQQDHFAISQYRYRPSKGSAIFGGTSAAVQTLSTGIQNVSNLQSLIGTAFLPMPNNISDSNNVRWGEDAMGNIAAAVAANTLGNFKSTAATAAAGASIGSLFGAGMDRGAAASLLIRNLNDLVSKGAVSQELSMLLGSEGASRLMKAQGMGVESESILARGAGIVPNSNLELLFNSPILRSFTFNYRMSPRSAEEAAIIRRIIRFFKQGMAVKKMSSKSGEASFFLGTPNVFKLEFRTGSRPIDGVNKFKSCALVSFSCNYTPDGIWAAYERGQPVSTVMQMTFNELEPIYDTDYQEGNIFGSREDNTFRDDLSSVSPNSIGY